jgi:CRP/FNR family transcriptional regulator, cyclic AMP receptor protein
VGSGSHWATRGWLCRVEPTSDKLLEFLRGIPLFGGLDDGGLGALTELLEERTFRSGSVVCGQGETHRTLYVVRRGSIVTRKTAPNGTTIKVVRLGRGEFFGETSLVEIHPCDTSFIADDDATLYALTARNLYSLYQQDAQAYLMVVMNIARELSRRLRRAEDRICEMAEESGDDERTQVCRVVTR